MHKFAKQIMECVKTKVEAMGIDNIEGQHLEELEKWTEIAKNIVCYDKDYNIVEVMKEAENDDNIRAIEMYEDYPERRYYDNYRYKTSGRFAPKGKGSYMPRRGYDEPPYYHMNPDMYREHTPEYYRDMDRMDGKMYYTETGNMSSSSRCCPSILSIPIASTFVFTHSIICLANLCIFSTSCCYYWRSTVY